MAHYHTIISVTGNDYYGGILELDEDEVLRQRILGKFKLPKSIRKSKIVKELRRTVTRSRALGVCASFCYILKDKVKDGDIISGAYVRWIKSDINTLANYREHITYDVRLM